MSETRVELSIINRTTETAMRYLPLRHRVTIPPPAERETRPPRTSSPPSADGTVRGNTFRQSEDSPGNSLLVEGVFLNGNRAIDRPDPDVGHWVTRREYGWTNRYQSGYIAA